MRRLKLNCWEYKKCGRDTSSSQSVKNICPAALYSDADGVNGGKNAGRICWVVAGTFCDGDVQGTFAQKLKSCQKCDFYNFVGEQEDDD